MPIVTCMRLGGPSSFFLWGRRGNGFFPLPVHQILRFPEKKERPIAGYCRLRIPTPSNTEFRSEGTKRMFVFTLRRGTSDFGLTQGIKRAREDEFVILAWD